ncbi:MAG TPA: polysaccharide biosynthesis tyrosine autokinase [Polyangiaceae bacterium]
MPNSEAKISPSNEAIDIAGRALKKHWLLAIIVSLGVFAAFAFYTVGQKRIYRATAMVQIDPNPPRPLGKDVQGVVDVGSGSYWSNKEYYGTQVEILRGLALARETVRALGLQNDAAFVLNTPRGVAARLPKGDVSIDAAASVLLGRLGVELIKDSRLVVARLDDADPERARRILSTLLDIYLERNISQVVVSSTAASEWLRGQTDKLKSELESSELALHEYKKSKRILSVSLDDQSNMLRGEMQQLSAALTTVNGRKEALLARVRELDKVDPNDATSFPATELLSSPILSSLRQEFAQARGEYDSLLGAGKGEKYPEVEAARARVEVTRQALMSEVRNVQGALRSDLAAATREAQGISGLFEHAKQRAMDLNILEIEYRRLERSKDNTEKLFGLVLERSKETDLTGMLRFNNITVAEPAIVAPNPIKPKVPVNLTIGVVLGLLLGLGLAVGLEWFDRTIRVPEDVQEATGLPLLGLLPSLAGKISSTGYYSRQVRRHGAKTSPSPSDTVIELAAHALPNSNAAECARGIRTSLTFSSPDKPYRSILVTSASPSEGKTMVATTIAVAFAQAGQRVLLVDCDLRRARLHRVFKMYSASGVSSVLQDLSTLDNAIIATHVPNLSLLPAGPHVPNPAELLQSDSFEKLLTALKQNFDRVILDSPPVLVVTDPAVLSARVDTTVVVYRARVTRRDVARQAAFKLSELGANIAGVVLNAMEEPKRKGGYYYGYYSRDKYRSGAEVDSPT